MAGRVFLILDTETADVLAGLVNARIAGIDSVSRIAPAWRAPQLQVEREKLYTVAGQLKEPK